MAVKVGTFTAPGATGNQSITGLGFQPVLVIFWATLNTATGLLNANAGISFGAATSSTDRRCIAGCSNHNVATSRTERRGKNTRCISLMSDAATPTTGAEADFVSMDSDGFTINWSIASPAYIIQYLAIGGAGIQAKVGTYTPAASTGNQSFTGVGFKPDCLLVGYAASLTADSLNMLFGLGMATATAACYTSSSADQNGVNPSNGTIHERSDRLLQAITTAGTDQFDETLTTFDADGFTINFSAGVVANAHMYIAIKGMQLKVGSGTARNTTTGTKAYTGVGFRPQALFLISNGQSSGVAVQTDQSRNMIGATDGTAQQVGYHAARDAVTPSNVGTYLATDHIYANRVNDGLAVAVSATLASLDSDGFTLNFDVVTATNPEFGYLAIADPAATLLSLSDTGAGTETSALVATLTATDVSQGVEASNVAALLPGSDTLGGVDLSALVAIINATDAVSGSDILGVGQIFAFSDSGHATDVTALAVSLGISETATGDDLTTLLAALDLFDAGSTFEYLDVPQGLLPGITEIVAVIKNHKVKAVIVRAAPAVLFSDDFNRADGPIGNGWLSPTTFGEGPLQIVSGRVTPPGSTNWASGYRPDVYPADLAVEFDYVTGAWPISSGESFYVYWRVAPGFGTATHAYFAIFATDALVVFGSGGTLTPAGTGPAGSTYATLADNTRIRIEISGASVRVLYDDVVVLDQTDPTPDNTPGLVGIELGPDVVIDNLSIYAPQPSKVPRATIRRREM